MDFDNLLNEYSAWLMETRTDEDAQLVFETAAEAFVDYLSARGLDASQVTLRVVAAYMERRAGQCNDRYVLWAHVSAVLDMFFKFLRLRGVIDEDPDTTELSRRFAKDEEDNVEYLLRKPGFYKKGPGKFMLYLGDLDELREDD